MLQYSGRSPMTIDKNAIRIEFDVKVPMSDGINLATDIYRPPDAGPFPAILMCSPYSNKNPALIYLARNIAARGFTTLLQNIRGRFGSEGTFVPFENERKDGYDTLVWLSLQGWFNGQLSLLGWSYSSYANYLIMSLEPPAGVKVVSAVLALEDVDPYVAAYGAGAMLYHWALPWCFLAKGKDQQWVKKSYVVNGATLEWPDIFRMLPLNAIPEKLNIPVPQWKIWIGHPKMDDYWRGISIDQELRKIETPILHMTGWYDFCLKQTIDVYQCLSRRLDNQALLIGPWDHENIFSAMMRNLLPQQKKQRQRSYGADSDFDLFDNIINWFVSWTNGENPLQNRNRVRFFVRGGAYWRDERDWPVTGLSWTNFYLDEKGTLTTQQPVQEGEDHFSYDPADPVPTHGGAIFAQDKTLRPGPLDQRTIEKRDDVLIYTTAPLTCDLEVSGPLKAVLFVSSNAVDTDFTVKLIDVHPDETAEILQDGIVRARCRTNSDGEALLEPGKVYQFEIDLAATSNLFKAGHLVRVEVSSSNFPKFDRNLNTGSQIGTGADFLVAEQTIYHGGEHASYICLPISGPDRTG
jgi:putative CocE/NonD family hydrolase